MDFASEKERPFELELVAGVKELVSRLPRQPSQNELAIIQLRMFKMFTFLFTHFFCSLS